MKEQQLQTAEEGKGEVCTATLMDSKFATIYTSQAIVCTLDHMFNIDSEKAVGNYRLFYKKVLFLKLFS